MRRLSINLLILLVTASCERNVLCYEHNGEKKRVDVAYEWNVTDPNLLPAGMNILFYSANTSNPHLDFLDVHGGFVAIAEGPYSVISYNNDTERILFRLDDSFERLEAYTTTQVRHSAVDSTQLEIGMVQPDNLFVSSIDHLTVKPTQDTTQVTMEPTNIVKTIPFTFREIIGIHYLSTIRLSVSGLSGSVTLSSKEISKNTGKVFPSYKISGNRLEGRFKTFGFPVGENDMQEFVVEFFYGKEILTRRYDVTQMLRQLNRIEIVDLIEFAPIPNEEGFQPDIGDWEDEDVDFPV